MLVPFSFAHVLINDLLLNKVLKLSVPMGQFCKSFRSNGSKEVAFFYPFQKQFSIQLQIFYCHN
jgi:hypothetical protein